MAIIHWAQLEPYMEHFSCTETPHSTSAEAMSNTRASVSSYVNHSYAPALPSACVDTSWKLRTACLLPSERQCQRTQYRIA